MYKLYFSTSTGKLRCDYSDFRKSIKEIRKHEKETKFEIHTDKETVGAALLELDLIAGDDSEYGLYEKR